MPTRYHLSILVIGLALASGVGLTAAMVSPIAATGLYSDSIAADIPGKRVKEVFLSY